MTSFAKPLLANVTEAGDIVLLAIVLATTLVVGLALLAVDALVGRVGARSRRPPGGSPAGGLQSTAEGLEQP